jgi:hypothetical protein
MQTDDLAGRAIQTALAAVHGLNEHLTIILGATEQALGTLATAHPACLELLEIQSAALECAKRTYGVLLWSAQQGFVEAPIAAPVEIAAPESST